MKAIETDDNSGTMQEALDGGEGASWGPTGPDGGPLPGMVNPVIPTARPWDPQNTPCLRDCKHYMTTELHFEHGNYDGALGGYEPIQSRHLCRAIPGVFLELSADAPVYACSAWDPLFNIDVVDLKLRRDQYFARHPDHVPAPPKPPTEEAIVEVAKECYCEDFGAPKFEGVCSWCVDKQDAEDTVADEKDARVGPFGPDKKEETPDGSD